MKFLYFNQVLGSVGREGTGVDPVFGSDRLPTFHQSAD